MARCIPSSLSGCDSPFSRWHAESGKGANGRNAGNTNGIDIIFRSSRSISSLSLSSSPSKPSLFSFSLRENSQSFLFFFQVHALMSVLRFLGVVCRSCSLLTLDLPDNFHPRMLASLLRLLQVSGDNAPTNIKQLTGEGSTLHSAKETADSSPQQTPATTSRISEVMMCLFQGCSKDALLPLLQALCEELVSSARLSPDCTQSLFSFLVHSN